MDTLNSNLRVTLVQSNLLWESPAANCAHFEEQLQHLKDQTDLIILPEMFTTGFSMNTNGAEIMNGPSLAWMKIMANRLNAMIIGSIKIKENKQYYNRMLAVYPDENFVFYDKKHLFRMGNEHKFYTAGDKHTNFSYLGWKISLFVCYDLRFPVWSRNKHLEYDLAIYSANWPAPRAHAWSTLLRARAIENLAFIAGVNRVGIDGNLLTYQGDSALISFKGEALLDLQNTSSIQTYTISKSDLLDFRTKFPAHLDAD
jgi:omega-amidase